MLKIKVSGRASEGKTKQLIEICCLDVKKGSKVLYISFEERDIFLITRFEDTYRSLFSNDFDNIGDIKFISVSTLSEFEDTLKLTKDEGYNILVIDGYRYGLDSVDNFLYTDNFKALYTTEQLAYSKMN